MCCLSRLSPHSAEIPHPITSTPSLCSPPTAEGTRTQGQHPESLRAARSGLVSGCLWDGALLVAEEEREEQWMDGEEDAGLEEGLERAVLSCRTLNNCNLNSLDVEAWGCW